MTLNEDKMKQNKYCLVLKKKFNMHGLPMSRYRSTTKDAARLVVTMRLHNMVKFKEREDALFYLSNLSEKYPDQYLKYYPKKIEAMYRNLKLNPVRQLRTNKILTKIPRNASDFMN